MSETRDVVVVGGGVHGCGVAYELARRDLDVVLVEREALAAGASGGVGKRGVRANVRDPRELPLARDAQTLWPDLDEMLGADTGFEQIGGLQVVEISDDVDAWLLDRAHAVAEVQRAHGVVTEVVDRGRLDELQPGLAPSIVAATWCPADGMADQAAVTRAYAAAAEAEGAEIRLGAAVRALRPGSPHTVELEEGGTLRGRRVVVAANSGSRQLVSGSFGLDLPIWPCLPQVILATTADRWVPTRLVGHLSRVLSAKPLAGGIAMISGGYLGRWDASTGSGVPISRRVEENMAVATSVFPALEGAEVKSAVTDRLEAYSHDGVPIIDEIPGAAGVFVETGWSGHGFAIAPAVARGLAEWVATGRRPEALAPFGLARLGLG